MNVAITHFIKCISDIKRGAIKAALFFREGIRYIGIGQDEEIGFNETITGEIG